MLGDGSQAIRNACRDADPSAWLMLLGDWDQNWDETLAVGIPLLTQDFWWERGKKGPANVLIRGTVLPFESYTCTAWFLKFALKIRNKSEPPSCGERVTNGKQVTLVFTTFYTLCTKKGLFIFELHILWCFIKQNGELRFKLHFLFTSQSIHLIGLAERLSSLMNYLH